jgi:hypothetical protein
MALVHKSEDTILFKILFLWQPWYRFRSSRIILFVITFNSIRSQKGGEQQCRY